jgi:serine kinase of HPr protein (carbohydrate metabolism regulator)
MNGRPAKGDASAPQSADWRPLHANALVLGETGVLIRGPSGAGKSALTLALLELARDRMLFARLIGDDRASICLRNGRILARGAAGARGLIERRGYGIVGAATEPCAVVRLVVDLLAKEERCARLPEADALKVCLCGVDLPRLTFDARSGAIERAYATLGCLDFRDDKIMTGRAHFA